MKKFLLLFCSSLIIHHSLFSQGTEGDSLFHEPIIHTIKLYFHQSHWWDSLVYYKPLDFKMLADVQVDGNYIDSIGVQFKGNSSYNAPGKKKPFKIDFNEYVSGQNYDGLKTINLSNSVNDPTLMREKLYLDFCLDAGIPAPRAAYANLYLNTGHGTLGWTMACGSGQLIADLVSSRAPAGVSATRFSLFLISLGTPMIITLCFEG